MRRWLVAIVVILVVAGLTTAGILALRGDGDEASGEPIRVTPESSSIGIVAAGGSTAAPIARLPGITVVGFGEVEVKPDVAVVRLTVGSGSSFSGSDETVELIDEEELKPVVEALVDAGVSEDDVYVNTFSSPYGPSENAALITFKWPKPQEVEDILRTAQDAIRKQTKYDLQGVSVTFGRDECEGPEGEAMDAALVDARKRAEKLAALSDAKLGTLIAVSEAGSGGYLTAFAPQRCGVDEQLSPGLFEYQSIGGTADEVKVTTALEVTFALED